ncbi:MAG TPA: VanZ family protein [Rhizomicrobium sp.]
MNLRQLLHQVRRFDAWAVAPALLFIVFAELTHSRELAVVEVNIWDKALHFTAYAGLALMTTIAVRADRRALWWALGLILLGGVLEIVQAKTGRDGDVFDEIANALGVLAGLGVGWAGIAFLKARKLLDA